MTNTMTTPIRTSERPQQPQQQSNNTNASCWNDGEISQALLHFGPQMPALAVQQSSGLSAGRMVVAGQRMGKQQQSHINGFSSIHYYHGAAESTIEVSYLLPNDADVARLSATRILGSFVLARFRVSSKTNQLEESSSNSIALTCSECITWVGGDNNHELPAHEIKIQQNLQNLCDSIIPTTTTTNAPKQPSLLSLLSKLLHRLQGTTVISLLLSGQQERAPPPTTIQQQRQQQLSPPVADLALLLLRCAAASRQSTRLLSPLPPQSQQQQPSDSLPQQVLAWTHRIQALSSSNPQQQRNNQSNSSSTTVWDQEFQLFLLSLPWTRGAVLRRRRQPQGTKRDATTHKTPRAGTTSTSSTPTSQQHTPNNVLRLTLDLEPALGDDPPHFPRDTLTVYHGTKPENVWSILNYGLQNLSDTVSQRHGAMLGKGVYVTTTFSVADFFAKNQAQRLRAAWWRHVAMARLFQLGDTHDAANANPNTRLLSSILNNNNTGDDVSCCAVLEAQIPANAQKDGDYYVVPQSDLVRLRKLHIEFRYVAATRTNQHSSHTSSKSVWTWVVLGILVAWLWSRSTG